MEIDITGAECEKFILTLLIFASRKERKFSQFSLDEIGAAGRAGVTMSLMVLNSTVGLPLLFVTKCEK